MNSRTDFIYLNEQDMIRAGVQDMEKCIDSMEDMFVLLHKGDYRMEEKMPMNMVFVSLFPKQQMLRECLFINLILDLWRCQHT